MEGAPDLDAIAAGFGVGDADRLGHGGEAIVWALDDTRVLRVHRRPALEHAMAVAAFVDSLDRAAVPFALPEQLEIGEAGGTTWSIERRLPGRSLLDVLRELEGDARRRALRAYLDGAAQVRRLGVPPGWSGGPGEIFGDPPLRRDRWSELLTGQLRRQLDLARPILQRHTDPNSGVFSPASAGKQPRVRGLGVGTLAEVEAAVLAEAAAEPDPDQLTLVHGDWFPGNVLVGPDLVVTAVFDWSWLTVVGDPDHELRSATVFLRGSRTGTAADEAYCTELLVERWGDAARERVARARRIEAARFSPYDDDPGLHEWCVGVLSGGVL